MKILRNILIALGVLAVSTAFAQEDPNYCEPSAPYFVHILEMGPLMQLLLLLAWIAYGVWIWGLFRPLAQWKPTQMIGIGLCFCLLSMAVIAVFFITLIAFSKSLNCHHPVGMVPYLRTGLLYTGIFAAQLVLFAVLLWWRASRKKEEAR